VIIFDVLECQSTNQGAFLVACCIDRSLSPSRSLRWVHTPTVSQHAGGLVESKGEIRQHRIRRKTFCWMYICIRFLSSFFERKGDLWRHQVRPTTFHKAIPPPQIFHMLRRFSADINDGSVGFSL